MTYNCSEPGENATLPVENVTLSFDNVTFPVDGHFEGTEFFLSEEEYKAFAFVCNSIVSPSICLFGLIGNSLGLGVLWTDTRQQRLTIYTYLCCLTFVDSVYLFLGLVRNIPQIVEAFDEQMSKYIAEHMKLGTIYLDMVFSFTSRAVLSVMSLERLVALVRPFDVKHFILSKHPRKIIGGCLLFNVLFLLPFPIYLEVDSFKSGNITEYFVQFRKHAAEDMDKYMIVQTVVNFFLPAMILLFTNIAIPLVYSNIIKRRRTTFNVDPTGVSNQQRKITLTVFFITLLYLLCSLPNIFTKILAFIDEEYSFDGKHKLIFWFFIDISNLFEYINAANDSVIYILVSTHYRRIFKMKYCRCFPRRSEYADSEPEVGSSNMAVISSSITTGFSDRN